MSKNEASIQSNGSNGNKSNNGNNNNVNDADNRTISPNEAMTPNDTPISDSTVTTNNCGQVVSNNSSNETSDSSDFINMSKRRLKLPCTMISRDNISLWSILKNCIGKDMTRIAMPIHFNEPLSFIQRIVEYTEYLHLLEQACHMEDPVERMELVAAFAVSSLSANANRVNKPFNPLLGETYEYHKEDSDGFKIVCEQVSHHPPISAFHGENDEFVLRGSVQPKLKFWGKSIEIKPEGYSNVEIKKFNEVYTWKSPACCVHNIIVGRLWYEQYGEVEIVNHNLDIKCVLNFKSAGWFGKDLDRLDGFIYYRGEKVKFLYGKWPNYLMSASISDYNGYLSEHPQFKVPDKPSEGSVKPFNTPKKLLSKVTNSLSKQLTLTNATTDEATSGDSSDFNSTTGEGVPEPEGLEGGQIPKSDSSQSLDIPNSRLLWLVKERPADSAQFYGFTELSMQLNYLDDEIKQIIPPTDSRLRPDIRILEEGRIDEASSEKNRLEEKQRDVRKRKPKNAQHKPLWFDAGTNANTKEDDWFFNGSYWKRQYAQCPDIF